MTDQERADAWLIDWLDWLPAGERDAFTRALAIEFDGVRRAERRAIAAWAASRGGDLGQRIARGEHAVEAAS